MPALIELPINPHDSLQPTLISINPYQVCYIQDYTVGPNRRTKVAVGDLKLTVELPYPEVLKRLNEALCGAQEGSQEVKPKGVRRQQKGGKA